MAQCSSPHPKWRRRSRDFAPGSFRLRLAASGKRTQGEVQGFSIPGPVNVTPCRAHTNGRIPSEGNGLDRGGAVILLPARNLQNSSAEYLQKSPFKSELAKLFGGSAVENKIGVMVEPGTTLPAPLGSRACFPKVRWPAWRPGSESRSPDKRLSAKNAPQCALAYWFHFVPVARI